MRAALATCQRSRVSYWDAMIVEAARALGCGEVLSEDLNDGQSFDGVVVRNPFAPRVRRART
jgi:predicted nucleic acid-binding protein